MSTKMKQYANKLLDLLPLKNKEEDFEKSPQGYALRERACLAQLCMHANKTVRRAAAELPILRDMFVIAMYEREDDKKIKSLLHDRYIAALDKESSRDIELEAAQAENTLLKQQLKEL